MDYITPGVALSAPLEKRAILEKRWDGLDNPLAWWIRSGLQSHSPATDYPTNPSMPEELQSCGRNITPACYRALYNMPTPDEVAREYPNGPGNGLAVWEGGNFYNQSDLNAFFTKYARNVPNNTHPMLDSIEGALVNQSAGAADRAESNVDISVMYALTYPQTITLYQIGTKAGYQPTGDTAADKVAELLYGMENMFDALDGSYCTENDTAHGIECGIYSPAQVTSISYGGGEINYPPKQQQRQCNEFMKLSLQGHTFIASSGDYGVSQDQTYHPAPDGTITWTNGCIDPSNLPGTLASDVNGTVFSTNYPSTCPWVLSVGATMLNDNDTVLDAESAMNMPVAVSIEQMPILQNVTNPEYTSSSSGYVIA